MLLALADHPAGAHIVAGGVLLGYSLWRGFVPLRIHRGSIASVIALLAELLLALLVIVVTGQGNSPYVFSAVPPIAAAGFGLGFAPALRMAVGAIVAVGAPTELAADGGGGRVTVGWASELVLVALVTGYARRLFTEAEARTGLVMEELGRLTEANSLLSGLHRVAQALPASLDLSETVLSTVSKVRDLVSPDVVAVLLRDESARSWDVAAVEGVRLSPRIDDAALAPPLRRAAYTRHTVLVEDLGSADGPGLGFRSNSGVYSPLVARGVLVGLLAVESSEGERLDARSVELVDGIAPQAAMAVDNAHWFARLRTMGADEERSRIARDLHDRVGSSLAYLGFELDRIARNTVDPGIDEQLKALRQDVRRVVGEVRDALYDLRTDVSERTDLIATLTEFVDRVGRRSDANVTFSHRASARLPLLQEREMWRIAQEAITNAERHARAAVINVRWECERGRALLMVRDDGAGLSTSSKVRLDSYGMLGMRERADAIGARLDISSEEGRGTTVRCTLGDT